MSMQDQRIVEVVRHDPRYMYEAYEFVLDALNFTQKTLGRSPLAESVTDPGPEHHVSGRELLAGAVELARREFGLLARLVFRQWGIHRTDDIGELVFNLIDSHLLSKTDSDTRADFHNVFDLDKTLTEGFTIPLDEIGLSRQGGRR